ncbi:RNA-binding S4 domain-containing protein [Roseospira goensis]|uniref:Ribosome-associated heat shock protein Hsp15 n=1 Tax=Roseospira goensis TaxID=391922 RepID=A0A7W6RXA6_9PROT|nr:RNA-binding S4 domain-containing protein [Roseospira goensis]MBB4284872.1 ribosome-associated heat shock protein Hsp15 [Roseospira goensis]
MADETLRLDKWLWHARFRKTRGLAQALCTGGHVRLNGTPVAKASVAVRPGDDLELILGPYRRRVRVVALGTRRGPAPEAQALYEETAPPERLHDPVMAPTLLRAAGSGRPTKRDRRAMDRLRGRSGDEG